MLLDVKEALEETPLGLVIASAAVVALLCAGLALLVGLLRGHHLRKMRAALQAGEVPAPPARFSIALELLTVGLTLIVPVLTVATIELSRQKMFTMLTVDDPSQRVALVSASLSGQLHGMAVGCLAMVLQLPLAGAALGLSLIQHRQLAGLRHASTLVRTAGADSPEAAAWLAHPGPTARHVLPVTVGVGGVAAHFFGAVIRWCGGLIEALNSVGDVDPEQKAATLLRGIDEARLVFLEHLPVVSGIMAAAVAVAALLLFYALPPARSRHALAPSLPAAPALSWSATLVTAGSCLALAALFSILALPYQQENANPLPVKLRGNLLGVLSGITLPKLVGPDRLHRAPLIAVSTTSVSIEDHETSGSRQHVERLGHLREKWMLANPDHTFPGDAVLAADKSVRMDRIIGVLRSALRAGYTEVLLVFHSQRSIDRPLFGRLPVTDESAATLKLADSPPTGTIYRFVGDPPAGDGLLQIAPPPELNYERYSRAVVQARRKGRPVVLLLPNGAN